MMLDNDTGANFAFSGCTNINHEKKVSRSHVATNKQIGMLRRNPHCLFLGNFIGDPSTTIFRNNTGLLFDKRYKWLVDIEFYIRVLRTNPKFVFVTTPLVCVTEGSSQQVTAACVNDKRVQIPETLMLYAQLTVDRKFSLSQMEYFWGLFAKFNIKSEEAIRNCGFSNIIPPEIIILLSLRRIALLRAAVRLWVIGKRVASNVHASSKRKTRAVVAVMRAIKANLRSLL